MVKLGIKNKFLIPGSQRSCTSRPAASGFPVIIIIFLIFLKIVSSHFHNKVRRAIGMAQLPRRVGKCQEWMRFGTPEWRVPAESRADFPGRTRRHAPATDSTLQANRDYCSATAALSCLHANRSAIPARPGASGTGFWFTQLSLQEAGSSIDGSSSPGNRQYNGRAKSGFRLGSLRFRLGTHCQVSQSPSHIRSGRFLDGVVMTKMIQLNPDEKE